MGRTRQAMEEVVMIGGRGWRMKRGPGEGSSGRSRTCTLSSAAMMTSTAAMTSAAAMTRSCVGLVCLLFVRLFSSYSTRYL